MEWVYTATRLTHLISVLNSDDATVRELARAPLLLELRKRKAPLAKAGQDGFLGFRKEQQRETGHTSCRLWSSVRLVGPKLPVQQND